MILYEVFHYSVFDLLILSSNFKFSLLTRLLKRLLLFSFYKLIAFSQFHILQSILKL